MSVKPGGHRQRQAEQTRVAIGDAARRRFAASGYTATTIEAIAREADIPAPTIYSAFGSKRAILESIRARWTEDVDVAALYRQAMASPDPADRLRRAAHWTRRQMELGSDVIETYQEAARVDPEAAAVWAGVLNGRASALARLIESMAADLRPGLDAQAALDRYLSLTVLDPYRVLVRERGWSPDAYERWLGDLLVSQLLRADPDTAPADSPSISR
jgi:AcrR family transcriptional regulator